MSFATDFEDRPVGTADGPENTSHRKHRQERTAARRGEAVSDSNAPSITRRLLLAAATVAILIVGVAGYGAWKSDTVQPTQPLVFHTVSPSDLPITVTERGNLESQLNVDIICEVDDIEGDGMVGTQIVWVVPNGASVKKDELLVELDSARHLERLDRQILDTEAARAAQIQAKAKHENQKTQNETLLADAKLEVQLSQLELKMFADEVNGTQKLEVEAIERVVEDINNEILAAQGTLELKRNEKLGIETLFKLGYAGKQQLDQSRLDFLQAESTYAAKMNKLKTQLATLAKKQTYEREMQELTLNGKLDTATRKVVQVERNNEALLAQSEAALHAAEESLKKEEERLLRYRDQISKCKIYAPQDGMVAYTVVDSRYSNDEIREGAAARPRQKLMTLPNLSRMQVQTSVHESVLDQVKPGLSTAVRVDAFPDRLYQGTILSVAVLPDQGGWFGSDTKVYRTIITVNEEVQGLKPGMTAVAEIHVERLPNVLAVPVQAIVQSGKQTSCYVQNGDQPPERRQLKLGRSNDKLVQIVEGLRDGDRVVLNPMALAEEKPKTPEEQAESDQAAAGGDVLNPAPVNPAPSTKAQPAGEAAAPSGPDGPGRAKPAKAS